MLEIIHSIDISVFSWVLPMRAAWLDNLFLLVTMLGKSYVVAGLAVVFSFFLWRAKKKNFLLPLWLAITGCGIFIYLLKIIIARPRPIGLALIAENSFSFPSGHAAIAAAFYGIVIYFLFCHIKTVSARSVAAAMGAILIILVGFSRIYLGVHYFSDVVGGYLLGGAWLMLGKFLIKRRETK